LIATQETLDVIDGTTIDFEQQGINHVFVYKNPKATGECGCGESFTTH
jgi:iron-sulfur cluster assembly protein